MKVFGLQGLSAICPSGGQELCRSGDGQPFVDTAAPGRIFPLGQGRESRIPGGLKARGAPGRPGERSGCRHGRARLGRGLGACPMG